MIDIASLNSNLPTYFEALDSSNSDSNQTLLPNNAVNNNNANNNEGVQAQSFLEESTLLPNNNNVVLQGQSNVIPSSTLIQSQTIVQQSVLQSPVALHSNSLYPPNAIYSTNPIMYNNTTVQNTVNNQEIFQQSSQPSPSPYNNNTIVSPMSRVTIPNQPQYVLNKNIPMANTLLSYPNASPTSLSINAQMNPGSTVTPGTPLNPSNNYINQSYTNTSSNNVMFPPNTLIGHQGNINHAYSAPVFSNNLSPPSLPNYEINSGLASLNMSLPTNAVSTVNQSSNTIQTPIISNQISTVQTPIISNANTPMNLSNNLIIPTELSTDLTSSIDISTPLVMSSSMPVLSNDLSTPLQSTTTPILTSSLFNVNSADSTINTTNASLVIPSDLTCSISLDNHQVSSLDSLSPMVKVNSLPSLNVPTYSMPSSTPPTNSKIVHFDYSVRTEDVPLLNVGATPSVTSKDFINSLPTPKDNHSMMKCAFNKEGITLDSIAESPQQEINKSLEMKIPISPKEEHARGSTSTTPIGTEINNKATYPSPHTFKKRDVPGNKNATITVLSSEHQILNQEEVREERVSIEPNKSKSKAAQQVPRNEVSVMPTPKATPSASPYANVISTPLTNSMPTPLSTPLCTPKMPEISTPLAKTMPTPATPSTDSKKIIPIVQERHKHITKKKRSFGKNITAPVVLSYLTSVVGSIKARSNLPVSDKNEKEVSGKSSSTTNEEKVKVTESTCTTIPKTVPVKFTEPLAPKESLTFTEPAVFVDPINKENEKGKTESVSIPEEEKKDDAVPNNDKASVIELVKEANIKNKSQSLAYTKYLLEKKFTYPKAKIPKKNPGKQSEDEQSSNTNKNVSRNHVVELPSPAILKPKNYTEPLPFIDTGDLTLEDLLNEATIQNKNITYGDILIGDNEMLKSKENEKENISMSIINSSQKEGDGKKSQIEKSIHSASVGIKRKEKGDGVTEDSVTKKRKIEEKSDKKRGHEVGDTISNETKKKKKSKQDSKKKNKDISEDGVMSKVKYNSNNISLYVSELNVLTKFQTKDNEDIYPLRCVCEGDLEDKEFGLEDLVCTYPNCNKHFVKSIHLEKHFIEHGDDFRPYQCPNCTKNFRRRYDLMRHSRIHNYIIPYRCSRCLRGFTRSDSCARHTKTRQCRYFDFEKINEKKENPPYYTVVKDPSNKTEKDIIIIPLNKEKIKD